MEKRLWEYIDGTSAADEKSAIEKLIAENAEWREQYKHLLELNEILHTSELEQPSLRFTKNVMEEIAKYQITPAAKQYINNKIIYGIAAFFITVIVSFVVYGFSQINWNAGSSKSSLGIDFTAVDYSQMFNNAYVNVFMMLNVVLVLMLFDRILRSRKNQYLSTH